jgi:hypothetical protein
MRQLAALAIAAAALAGPAPAEEVDLEIVLMVDVSRSMTAHELEIQRRGYAAALNTDAVYAAVQSGLLQKVAMAYVEWAGIQRVVVDWRLLESREDLAAFAEALGGGLGAGQQRTSISEALVFGTDMIETNGYEGIRRVLDVSGDGPNNQGRPVTQARDAAVAAGLVINGLPLMTREGMGAQGGIVDLDGYYRDCVTGGPGSFVVPVYDWDDFADAVRRKLVLEMAAGPPAAAVVPAQFAAGYDCLIGEKIWRDRQNWDYP